MEHDNQIKSDVVETAKKRFRLAEEAEMQLRKKALEDLRFRSGDQWDDRVRASRDQDRRPCLTINKLPGQIRQVTNDQRQNRPAIKISPVDDITDPELAKIYQGLIRHIERNSKADVAYDTAFEAAATHGFGYFRVLTEYSDPMSFEQDIKIKRIRNAFNVYLDPNYQEPDGSDAEWGFIFETMTSEDYKAQYGETKLASMNDWVSIGDKPADWLSDDHVRVAEYFYKEYKTTTIYLVEEEGQQVTYTEEEAAKIPNFKEEFNVIDERKSKIPVVKWCKINSIEIIDETEWLGSYIPIIPVLGDELEIDGEKILEGMVRHAKDPQRMYNYWVSSETETIALAPKAPFIGAEGQFEGYEEQWRQANTKSFAFLQYKPKALNGTPMPPPMRNVQEPPIAAITNARLQSADDIKSTTGIYDASLGARSNENSGIAIQRRNFQAQTSNFHYIDNLSRSLRHLGLILVELIPKVYDTPRAIRIIGEDDEQKVVLINQVFEEGGKQKRFDMDTGKFDVDVSTGPSYASKREEALDSMLALTQKYPKVAEVASDLMVKNMDWPGAQEIAERLKKTIPPEFLEGEEEEEIPPRVQAEMQKQMQMIEMLSQQLNEATSTLQTDQHKMDHEKEMKALDAKVKLADIEAKMRIAQLKEEGLDSRTEFQAEIDRLNAESNLMINQDPSAQTDDAGDPPMTMPGFEQPLPGATQEEE